MALVTSSLDNISDTSPDPETETGYDVTVEVAVTITLLVFLAILGTIGNSIVVHVYLRKRDSLVSTYFILVLAFVDLVTCSLVIPATVVMEYLRYMIHYDILCRSYKFLIASNIPFSALIMVAIAVDRYLCICHPFLRVLTIYRAKLITGALALYSAALGIVVALTAGVYTKQGVNDDDYYSMEHMNNSYASGSDIYAAVTLPSSDNGGHTLSSQLHTVNASDDATYKHRYELVNWGLCYENNLILSDDFQWYFQKFYTAMYLVCFLVVIVLYTLIYHSVLARRQRRLKQQSKSQPLVENNPDQLIVKQGCDNNLVVNTSSDTAQTSLQRSPLKANGDCNESGQNGAMAKEKKPQLHAAKSIKREKLMRMANIRTAAMLFVVTLVFVVTFLPSFLMTNKVIPYNLIVFYLYFANNVANPVIYSFMNQLFREDLRKIFCAEMTPTRVSL